jgi:hypothetical protein
MGILTSCGKQTLLRQLKRKSERIALATTLPTRLTQMLMNFSFWLNRNEPRFFFSNNTTNQTNWQVRNLTTGFL